MALLDITATASTKNVIDIDAPREYRSAPEAHFAASAIRLSLGLPSMSLFRFPFSPMNHTQIIPRLQFAASLVCFALAYFIYRAPPLIDAYTQTQAPPEALTADQRTADFGVQRPHSKVECVFELCNRGDDVIVLQDALPTCGCTFVHLEKTTLRNGEKFKLRVLVSTGARSGRFSKGLQVRYNKEADIRSVSWLPLFITGIVADDDIANSGRGRHSPPAPISTVASEKRL